MSIRFRQQYGKGNSSPYNRSSQPSLTSIVPGYFNPQALEASKQVVKTDLDTLIENLKQAKELLAQQQQQQPNQPIDQMATFWDKQCAPLFSVLEGEIRHALHTEHQKVQYDLAQSQIERMPMRRGASA